ncbi:MAG: 3,4-dihydroxy-2-butanone-4-phosphate synthase [Parvularcula sp.]|jgi:3,4-dihydroxy-2-butanone 4-phosphate synthase|nr:3,4-dihydroxy-2-butanone-4-phosphate synthase [Parvularcula sp.]
MSSFVSVEMATETFRQGRFVIIADDEGRENEGDLVIAAEFCDAAAVNFMIREGRGLVCCSLDHRIIERLGLELMVPPEENKSGFGTGFTVSVEAATGVTTGISAPDRARTIEVLIDPASGPNDLARPGHMFPLRAHPGGLLARGGQTEASVELAKLAGLRPGAVICEIINDDGTMARRPDLETFSKKHDIPITTTEALRRHILALNAQAAE